ncbi:MAG: sigma 54-interacting transcriptional regulator [Lachnospiraceae bacterium]|nr:sigma 54-interacting transcriptional regulator [Lachnospiraceae bacterium]
MKTKTRILAVVPYNGIKEIMNEIAADNEEIDLTVHIGTLQKGLEIVQSYNLDDFDIVVARGGTANLFERHIKLPIARIEISVYDILRAIKLAENYTSRFAIVGISSTVENAKLLRNLLQYNIKIVTLAKPEDDRQAILDLLDQGYEMVLCDMRTTNTAYELGMNYILITSGRESLEATFTQAISLAHRHSFHQRLTKLFKTAMSGSREYVFIYDGERNLVYSSLSRNLDSEYIFLIIEQNMDTFFSDSSFQLEERKKGLLLTYHCSHATIDQEPYVFIYLFKQDVPALIDELGISLYENPEAMVTDSEFYGSANLIGITRKTLEAYSRTLQPVLILGEKGTGKDKSASFLYRHSEFKKHPFFIIDCESTNQKKWNYFMESPNSPLNDIHITIYIKNLQALHDSISGKFLPYLKQNDLCRRNRFLFSYTLSQEIEITNSICQYLMNTLSCLVLHLTPLRDRTDDIPNIATLYISQANINLGKQVVGFEPGALALIQDFNWNQNLAQFKRVIHQLIVLTEGDYISTDLVRQTLKQETPKTTESLRPGYEIVNTNQSLEDISYDIARVVLEQEDMNRAKTAERLGISRTTLWRMLQK